MTARHEFLRTVLADIDDHGVLRALEVFTLEFLSLHDARLRVCAFLELRVGNGNLSDRDANRLLVVVHDAQEVVFRLHGSRNFRHARLRFLYSPVSRSFASLRLRFHWSRRFSAFRSRRSLFGLRLRFIAHIPCLICCLLFCLEVPHAAVGVANVELTSRTTALLLGLCEHDLHVRLVERNAFAIRPALLVRLVLLALMPCRSMQTALRISRHRLLLVGVR